jgi:cobalt-zinc-cadmium resistance protein CzcA
LARYGLNMAGCSPLVATAIGGQEAGQLFEGDRRFDIVVRLPEACAGYRSAQAAAVCRCPAAAVGAVRNMCRCRSWPRSTMAPGPNQISRENGKRRVVVTANVRGRDIGSFVADAQRGWPTGSVSRRLLDDLGRHVRAAAVRRIAAAARRAGGAWLLVFVLLFTMFGNARDGLLVFTGIPFALTVASWRCGCAVFRCRFGGGGLHCLSGVAVLNGLVMLSLIRTLREGHGAGPERARGRLTRLRPVLMTALVASLGFLPMAIGHGHRCRGAAAAGHRGDRRGAVVDGADAVPAAGVVSMGASAR